MSTPMLDGKVVVVTGAGAGIGREVALAMAAEGAAVVVNDTGTALAGESASAAPAQQLAQEIVARGGRAAANIDSVAEPASAERIVACALDHFGRVDAVVHHAGLLRDRFFQTMSADDWDAVLRVHLHGAFYVNRAAAPHMQAQAGGALIHMTSAAGLIGNFGQANEATAGLGLVALSKAIALDMMRFGVRANCIAPFAWSRIADAMPPHDDHDAGTPAGRPMTADKIAPLCVYLASDAAREVNAQVFAVRNNEIFVMSQPRPLRSVHRAAGWTPREIAAHAMPALRASFVPVERAGEVFSWDPV